MGSDEKPHRKLKVWQVSVDFVVELYQVLERLPPQEKFGLTSQMQRAAVSIPSISDLQENWAKSAKCLTGLSCHWQRSFEQLLIAYCSLLTVSLWGGETWES